MSIEVRVWKINECPTGKRAAVKGRGGRVSSFLFPHSIFIFCFRFADL